MTRSLRSTFSPRSATTRTPSPVVRASAVRRWRPFSSTQRDATPGSLTRQSTFSTRSQSSSSVLGSLSSPNGEPPSAGGRQRYASSFAVSPTTRSRLRGSESMNSSRGTGVGSGVGSGWAGSAAAATAATAASTAATTAARAGQRSGSGWAPVQARVRASSPGQAPPMARLGPRIAFLCERGDWQDQRREKEQHLEDREERPGAQHRTTRGPLGHEVRASERDDGRRGCAPDGAWQDARDEMSPRSPGAMR